MRKLFIALLFSVCYGASGTHWMTYYVYHEVDYVQGMWSQGEKLEAYSYTYLDCEKWEDSFGTELTDFGLKVLERLSGKKPELYRWNYNLTFISDTALISSTITIPPEDLLTIQNEVTASLVFNGVRAVWFQIGQIDEVWTERNLTLPYMDIIHPSQGQHVSVSLAGDQNTPQSERKIIQSSELAATDPLMSHGMATNPLMSDGLATDKAASEDSLETGSLRVAASERSALSSSNESSKAALAIAKLFPFNLWFILSVALNIFLLFIFIRRRP